MKAIQGYNWPGPWKPFDHQKVTTDFILRKRRCFVLNEMGTGKTASVLWGIDRLLQAKKIKKTLIIAPLSTLERVWYDESFKLLTHRRSVLLYGSAAKRKKLYESDWEIGIINFDGVKVLYDLIRNDPDLDHLVVDEATAYRNSQTNRWKAFSALAAKVRWLWMLTGTPCPQEPADAWALAKLIGNPECPKFFGTFRRRTMFEVGDHQWLPRKDGYQQAFKLLQPAIRFRKEDCIDLPPMTFQSWEVGMTKQQARAYKDMQKAMRIEFAEQGDKLPAVNAADKVNKLRQIACGVVKDTNTGEYVGLPMQPRVDAVLSAIEMAAAKVIVVVPFKGAIYELERQLRKHHKCGVLNGDVPAGKRGQIIREFCETDSPHVLLVHPKVMAHGLTLTVADTMVFYAPIYSNEESQQVIQRINRPGQTRSMTVIQLAATALEWSIYDRVEKRAQGEQELLDLYRNAAEEKLDAA